MPADAQSGPGMAYITTALQVPASRGVTRTVAARARRPIIGARYSLVAYFARYAASIWSFVAASRTGSKATSFVIPAAVMRPAFCFSAA